MKSLTKGSAEWYALEREVEAEERERQWKELKLQVLGIILIIILQVVTVYYILPALFENIKLG